MNQNWNRWIFASASKVFKAVADAFPVHFFVAGTKRDTDSKSDYIVFRMQGPNFTEVSHNYFRVDVTINILYAVTIASDFHLPYKIAGMLAETMDEFCVYKYGDDDSLLGTLRLSRPVNVNHLGQTDEDTNVVQGMVVGTYVMFLDEN